MQVHRNQEIDEVSKALDSTFNAVADADSRGSNSNDLRKQALTDRGASPSSVLQVPLDGSTHQRSFAEEPTFTVVFGDEGAEVTVDVAPVQNEVPDIPASTPSRNLRAISSGSLLDEEGTQVSSPNHFSRSPISPAPTSMCLNTNFCCAGVNFGRDDGAGSVDIVKLEARITKFLSDPLQLDGFCLDWQSWSYQMTLLLPGHSSSGTTTAVKDVRQVLRNRAFDMSARRHRMRTLRRDISPFNTTPSPKKFSSRLKKTKSFDIELHAPAVERVSKDAGNLWKLTSVWESVQICSLSQPPVDSPAVIRARVRDSVVREDTCYDSDPEDFIRRSSNRRANTLSIHNDTPQKPHLKASHSFGPVRDRKDSHDALPSLPPSNSLYFHDDDSMRLSIQEFMNERFTLIFHKKSATQNTCTPHAVTAWIERGQHLNYYIIQPKFMWQSIREKKGRRGSSVPESEITSFDLIDVSRVLQIDRVVDREIYPFAKSNNCFIVKTMEETHLFEAETAVERLRLVNMLKMMVARLGSKLIVGDTTFVDEFFIMSVDQGPGDAPYWADI